jgi:hypothetical protein
MFQSGLARGDAETIFATRCVGQFQFLCRRPAKKFQFSYHCRKIGVLSKSGEKWWLMLDDPAGTRYSFFKSPFPLAPPSFLYAGCVND